MGVNKVVFQYVSIHPTPTRPQYTISSIGTDNLTPSPKALPWFVSDVTPPDFTQTISLLQQSSEWSIESDSTGGALDTIAARFSDRVKNGIFELSVPLDTKLGQPVPGSGYEFWTSPSAYYYMRDEAPGLVRHLEGSSLVIFKGDLK